MVITLILLKTASVIFFLNLLFRSDFEGRRKNDVFKILCKSKVKTRGMVFDAGLMKTELAKLKQSVLYFFCAIAGPKSFSIILNEHLIFFTRV